MTETMPRTSTEKSASGHKTATSWLSIKQKQCFATLNFCQGIARLKYTHQQIRHSNKLTCMLSSTIFLTKSHWACKFFISTIQTLNLSLHCTYPKLSRSMEVNKEELLIHILQGTNNTDGMCMQ